MREGVGWKATDSMREGILNRQVAAYKKATTERKGVRESKV